MSKTQIEWTERTWNPIVGCSIVSPGCTNCYAMKMAGRIEAMGTAPHYADTTKDSRAGYVWTGKVVMAPERTLFEPLRRKKPTTYFVNSMGDLFHESAPDEWIDWTFAVMALARQHTFQVLTKRAKRMRQYLNAPGRHAAFLAAIKDAKPSTLWNGNDYEAKRALSHSIALPNVWLGVSTERQQEADERIPQLLQTPAAVRFISAEPLLGPIDLTRLGDVTFDINAFTGAATHRLGMRDQTEGKLDWVIVGGESGPGARRMQGRWAREIRDQCAIANVPFFFKQWGAHDSETHDRVGKKAAGRLLDGREHNDFPQSREVAFA